MNAVTLLKNIPASAFDIVGFDTTTGMTPGALLIAPK